MSFEWTHYLRLAQELSKSNNQASNRAAVSRAYYAAFNIIKATIEDKASMTFSDNYVHSEVISKLVNQNNHVIAKALSISIDDMVFIGNSLKAIRKQRNEADYNIEWNFTNTKTIQIIELAETLINMV